MFWIFSKIQRSKPDLLFSEFSGFYILFNLQLSRFSFRCQTRLLQRLFIITGCFSFVNNFLNLFFRFFWNDCYSLKREDYNSKPQTICQQLFCIILNFMKKYFDPIIVKKLKTFFSNISSLYVKFYFCGFLIPIFRKKENTAHTIRTINGTEKESVFVYSTPTNVATQDAGIIIRLVIL